MDNHENGRFDLDVRGLLAILSVVGAFSLAFTQLFVNSDVGAEIPAWAAAIVAGVTGFYFGSRAGSGAESGRGNGWHESLNRLEKLIGDHVSNRSNGNGNGDTTPVLPPHEESNHVR